MHIHGRCHCGNIAFELVWEPSPGKIPARACGCSFCTRHGGVWTATPDGSLVVAIQDLTRISRYTFATGTAQFHLCRTCGVVAVVTSEIDGRLYAVVNVNTFEDVPQDLLQRAPASFEGESAASRLLRRQRGWIRNVQLVEAAERGPAGSAAR